MLPIHMGIPMGNSVSNSVYFMLQVIFKPNVGEECKFNLFLVYKFAFFKGFSDCEDAYGPSYRIRIGH